MFLVSQPLILFHIEWGGGGISNTSPGPATLAKMVLTVASTTGHGRMEVSSPQSFEMERDKWQMTSGFCAPTQPSVDADNMWIGCCWSHSWVVPPPPSCTFQTGHSAVDDNQMWDGMGLLRLAKRISKPKRQTGDLNQTRYRRGFHVTETDVDSRVE